MALPTLTTEQRDAALAKAAATRSARADFKKRLTKREISALDGLHQANNDEVLGRIKVEQFLRALPGIGASKTAAALDDMAVAPTRRIRGLGPRQFEQLEKLCAQVDSRL